MLPILLCSRAIQAFDRKANGRDKKYKGHGLGLCGRQRREGDEAGPVRNEQSMTGELSSPGKLTFNTLVKKIHFYIGIKTSFKGKKKPKFLLST